MDSKGFSTKDGMVDVESKAGFNVPHPQSLTEAYSEIQKLWMNENDGGDVAREFVTLSDYTSFATVGMKSAIRDNTIWIVGSLLSTVILYFVEGYFLKERVTELLFLKLNRSPLYWFTKLASFAGVVSSTGICILMGKYYIGTATKRAINGLWYTRFSFLIFTSLCYFTVLGIVYKVLFSDNVLETVANCLSIVNPEYGRSAWIFLHDFLKKEIFNASIWSVFLSVGSVLCTFPFGVFFQLWNRKQKELDGKGV